MAAGPTVIGCLWTRLDENSPLPAFVDMATELAARSITLKLIVTKPPEQETTPLSVVRIPPTLSEFGRDAGIAGRTVPRGFDLDEFFALEQLWNQRAASSPTSVAAGLAAWHDLFECERPSAVLCWGTTFPHSRAMLRAGQQRMLPTFVLERGHLNGTLMASPFGQGAYAPPGLDPWFKGACEEARLEDWESTVAPLRGRAFRQARFSQEPAPLPERRRKSRILFLGSFDVGAGIGFEALGAGEPYASGLSSSFEAARALVNAVRAAAIDAELVVRPHPFDLSDYSLLEAPDVILARRHPLDDLFPEVDIVVGVNSTANAGAFLYDKPLVTLATTEFDGLGATHNVPPQADLGHALRLLIADDERRTRMTTQGRKVLLTLLTRHLMNWGNGSMPAANHVRDFAAWLAHFVRV